MKKFLSVIFVVALSAALLLGCTPQQASAPSIAPVVMQEAEGGVLCLKINPEIAIHYDASGLVTKVEGRNQDGIRLLKNFTGYKGKETSQVLTDLVEMIGQAGYFVEEAEGTSRRITLELDPGSQVPHEKFLEDMAAHVKRSVESGNWVGQAEYDYDSNTTSAVAAPTVPAAAPTTAGLCPICGDDDCDDGKYCDDADEKAENLREAENRKKGTPCPVCGDYDCDDGRYCDDADEKAENLWEAENRKNGTPCPVCGDYDCDDGAYCDDWDDRYDD